MLGNPQMAMYQTSRYYSEKVCHRKSATAKTLDDICKIVQEILKEVETQEPRFISTLVEAGGRYEGVHAVSPTEFEIILYLNQMGVFNFVDDGSLPGCAVLKLSDGRKRSMSLWVEFITASGYLSARKIRSRFQTLVAQAVDKSAYREILKMIPDTSEVRLRIHDKFVVQITCAFRCTGIWPRSASHWPPATIAWPPPPIVAEVKAEGFDLLREEMNCSKEPVAGSGEGKKENQNSMEGDAWAMSFAQAEATLLSLNCRGKCLSILKSLRDSHLEFPGGFGSPISNYIIKTLVLFECEKHPHEEEWSDAAIGERIIGVLLQLVSCLQCKKCPHYFIPSMDLLKGKPNDVLNQACHLTWQLLRMLMLNSRALEIL